MTCKSSQWLQSRERCYFKSNSMGQGYLLGPLHAQPALFSPKEGKLCSDKASLSSQREKHCKTGARNAQPQNIPSWTGPTRIIQSSSWQLTTALVLCRESPSVGAGGVSKAHVDSTSRVGCQRRGRGTRLPSWLRKRRRSVLHARVTGSTGN